VWDIIHRDDLGRVPNRNVGAPAFEQWFDLVLVPYEDNPHALFCCENRPLNDLTGSRIAPHGINGDERHMRYDDEMTSRPL
jgi:hypothetical protein